MPRPTTGMRARGCRRPELRRRWVWFSFRRGSGESEGGWLASVGAGSGGWGPVAGQLAEGVEQELLLGGWELLVDLLDEW